MPDNYELTLKRADGLTLIAKSNSGHWTVMDTTVEAGGSEGAMNPFEHFLASIAGCTSMDVLVVMRKKRIKLDDFSVHLTAERRDEHPRIATKIHLHFTLVGNDIEQEAVRQAIELSQTKYCSVSAMIRNDVPITTSFEIRKPE